MEIALSTAELAPSQVDYVNAHAPSTQIGDASELKALKAVFPEPRWFLGKNYYVTRVGISDLPAGEPVQHLLFGIEYDTDYYTGILLIPVAVELANNMMSQIEKADLSDSIFKGIPPSSGESP